MLRRYVLWPLGLLLLLTLIWTEVRAGQKPTRRPMTVEDLFRLDRVADPQVGPDGQQVVYVVTQVDLPGNKTSSTLWLAAADGKTPPRQLTTTPKKDRQPRWSPDGKWILFESNRSGTSQLWVIPVDGGEPKQLTAISTEATNPVWSPDGKTIAFVSAVWPEYSSKPFAESDALNKKRAEEIEKNPVKAKTFTRLFFRHWDSYVEDKRQHLFVMSFADGTAGTPRNATPGDRDAYPTSTTFSVGDDFTFSPDGEYLIFTAVPAKDEAWSTNYDLCRVPVKDPGKAVEWETLSKANPAADGCPRFSPDGKKLAFRAQKKSGYEADRWELYIVDCDPSGAWTGTPTSITSGFDHSVEELLWAPDGASLWFLAERKGETPVFSVRLSDRQIEADTCWPAGVCSGLTTSRDGKVRALLHATMQRPGEVFVARSGPSSTVQSFELSQQNAKRLAELDLPAPESVTVAGAGGTPMQMWILKPPGFDEQKKWPLVYLVHGGPQGAWQNGWSWRWCPQVWAAQGYVVALPNPRGSTGFGQQYTDEITGDWGGKCYEDLMKGMDYLERQPWLDKERVAAAGASFGGYMMNWFAVNTGRFKTLITHCSVWNFESMWGTTDELWFDEYEHGGLPWEQPGKYAEFSPHKKAGNLGKFKTPMLIIHNDLDFRCPIGQGHELFTALQRQNVPSRFINFPDEGHWVLKPANSQHWHREIFAWLKQYCPPGAK
jgi:dipeptidyl aminopeptidase/acylaminoacyl peptidase